MKVLKQSRPIPVEGRAPQTVEAHVSLFPCMTDVSSLPVWVLKVASPDDVLSSSHGNNKTRRTTIEGQATSKPTDQEGLVAMTLNLNLEDDLDAFYHAVGVDAGAVMAYHEEHENP